MHLTRAQLLIDLHTAYLDARRHKRNRQYQLKFEANLEQNLQILADELFERRYKPCPSTCFLIEDPKKREIFAAEFRDRIVHHLYYNYTHEMFERTFIADSYSCIKGRGTHYGISRLDHHIRQETQNYREVAYVMKIDIRGYFMHINRQKLLEICMRSIEKHLSHDSPIFDIVCYLTREIILLNPIEGCRIKGKREDWRDLPHDKSLFNSEEGCGLPIGNLTSQLFSNIYMNEFDQYMKRTLKCRHYGRYVDDAYVVSCDKQWLNSLVPIIDKWLLSNLGLKLHYGKLQIVPAHRGVEFLGAYIKPWRKYLRSDALRRMKRKVRAIDSKLLCDANKFSDSIDLASTLSSFGGLMAHWKTYKLRRSLFGEMKNVWRYGRWDEEWKKFVGVR